MTKRIPGIGPKRSEAEQRKGDARLLYDLEVEYRKVGWGDPAYPQTFRTDNIPRLRFTATVGREPEVEMELV